MHRNHETMASTTAGPRGDGSEPAPRVSVVMPCFNHAAYVGTSIGSILEQTMPDLELIVVDDASTDGSADILRARAARDPRIRLILHPRNLGASRSRNDGIQCARGEYIGFCDADDIWRPEKLRLQVSLLDGDPACGLTYCDAAIIDEGGQASGRLFSDEHPPAAENEGDLFEQLCLRNFINMQTVLVRRGCLPSGPPFDEGIRWVEDWWHWIRLSRSCAFRYDPRVLAEYRVHSASTRVTQKPGILKNRFKVGRRNLHLHRDISLGTQAVIWYQMGVDLCLLGRPRPGRRFLARSLGLAVRAHLSVPKILRMTGRLCVESCRRRSRP